MHPIWHEVVRSSQFKTGQARPLFGEEGAHQPEGAQRRSHCGEEERRGRARDVLRPLARLSGLFWLA